MDTSSLRARLLGLLAQGAASPERLTAALTSSLTRPPYPLNGPCPASTPMPTPVTPGQVRQALRELLSTGEIVTDPSTQATRRQYARQRPGNVIDPLALPHTQLRRARPDATDAPRVAALLTHLEGRPFTAQEIASVSRLPLSAVTTLLDVQVTAGTMHSAPGRRPGGQTTYRHLQPAPTPLPEVEVGTPDLDVFAAANLRFPEQA